MAVPLEKQLERWLSSGVVDASTAVRIRAFEQSQLPSERLRWPVLLALALGGILLCAGVLLFVSAHWDELSPAWRFSLVLLLVAAFPFAGAFTAERFPALSVTFYSIGTVCVGAGVFLSAQIFNLQEHWPNGILLWAIGALAGWLLLRNWAQAALLALLVPAWLAGEWAVRVERFSLGGPLLLDGLLLIAIAYLSVKTAEDESSTRTALAWVGGIALLPLALMAFGERHEGYLLVGPRAQTAPPLLFVAWVIAIGGPLAFAFVFRKRSVWANAIAAIWVLVIGTFSPPNRAVSPVDHAWNSVGIYLWAGLGALALVAWGLAERRRERINLGVVGFALTVLIFYFSNVMDKLGRAASLVGMGVLMLFGGWVLERARRQLVARLERSAP